MANTRAIIKRRKSVANIAKITKTMEMIATSRFKKASNRSTGNRLYADQHELFNRILIRQGGELAHPLLESNSNLLPTVVLVLSSNRGLCGGYNGALLKEAVRQINLLRYDSHSIELHASGKKAIGFFRFKNEPVSQTYMQFDYQAGHAASDLLAEDFIARYSAKEIRAVKVIYTRFASSARFYPDMIDLLPVLPPAAPFETGQPGAEAESGYLFAPDPQTIADALIPALVKIRLYQCFADASASEQVARMRSMKAASDNADQMIDNLMAAYNRQRQGQITGELLDIMGGVEALK